MNKRLSTYQKRGLLLSCVILIVLVICCGILIWLRQGSFGKHLVAEVYQNGVLLETADLNEIAISYQITVTGENGSYNIIEFRPGSVAVVDADCPDKLCVHMGEQSSSFIPITCLPNKVVIRLAESGTGAAGILDEPLDGVTY